MDNLPIYLAISLPLVGLLLFGQAKRRGEGFLSWYNGLLLLLTLCMTLVFYLTGVTPMSGFHLDIRWENVNFIPFVGILAFWRSIGETWAMRNLFGNILMFAPLGFLLPLVGPKRFGPFKTVLYGFSVSLLIECTQLFLIRGTDVDDLILNTSGVILGYLCYAVFRWLIPPLYRAITRKFPLYRSLSAPTFCLLIPYVVILCVGFTQRYLLGG